MEEVWAAALSAELEAERARLRWTQDEAARRSGLSIGQVQRAMSGKYAVKFGPLAVLCSTFGVPVAEVVARAERRVEA